jgi:23S rRNA (cytosine1962-C5)-methyltransferase
MLQTLILKNKADRRLRAGHPWIYSNEVDVAKSPLKQFAPGEQVLVKNAQGKAMGVAYVNPHALICARCFSETPDVCLDEALLFRRIQDALRLRDSVSKQPYYRLVFGDSDFLPGLVIDRYDDVFVVQIATAGMEQVREQIVEALRQLFDPKGIVLKNDARIRRAEQLPEYVEVAYGEVPERVELVENGVRFQVALLTGQKTGWFYDHRSSRALQRRYVVGKRVLDVFSYAGGWGVQAAVMGAEQVTCIDSSAQALELVSCNARLNQVQGVVRVLEGDAFEQMKKLLDDQQRFDVVVIDPPAFIPRRKDIKSGEQAYRRLNELAMRLLTEDGVLVSASCSMHLSRDSLIDILRRSSRHLGRQLQIVDQGGQSFDHPVHPAIAETEYLKAVFARVLQR